MDDRPFVVKEHDRAWDGWAEDQLALRGGVVWRTLISAGLTPSSGLTVGIARVPADTALSLHRHRQVEVYFILSGTGVVTVDGLITEVTAGNTVFIPGDALHSIRPQGSDELRLLYVLAANAFQDVEYIFASEPATPSSP